MRTTTAGRILAAGLAAVLLIAGCSDESGANAGGPTFDLTQLDPGNYSTTPRDQEQARTEHTGAMLEAARLGTALPAAVDIDARLVHRSSIYVDRRITPILLPSDIALIERAEFAQLTPGLVAGWQSRGQRRQGIGLGTALEMVTLRFDSAAAAANAAGLMSARAQQKWPDDTPVTVPDFGEAQARWSTQHRRVDAQLVRDDMVLLVRAEDPVSEPSEPTASTTLVQRALRAILDGLSDYTPTPADQLDSLPIDTDSMLARTLPLENTAQFTGDTDPSMVLPRQAWLHSALRADLAKTAYADTGVDLVAISGAVLYRAADAPAAARLLAALADAESARYAPIDSPPNMAGVGCYDRKDPKSSADRYPPTCFLHVGRYVAVVEGANTQQVHQRTAAQYGLLAEA
ncbi:MAG TPA: hypothetical protein VK083_16075 [Nocardia sp.]|uniref:DUF7373 family lipoprotein n=1 Tax=Nocardia sp. TaxID=1821 RepID=UPI002B4AB170|nr:hypothetical protein [Nocardia sp.]HLS78300.1 hypothetical protein [Nocardia sp.]